jgi:hypothetical protein
MGRAFLAGQEDALDFYNDVYAAPLFITAIVFLLLFVAGGIFTGTAIAASARWPRWTGWAYAVMTTGFVLSNFLLPVGQSITSALLFITTIVLAWSAGRETGRQSDQIKRPEGLHKRL